MVLSLLGLHNARSHVVSCCKPPDEDLRVMALEEGQLALRSAANENQHGEIEIIGRRSNDRRFTKIRNLGGGWDWHEVGTATTRWRAVRQQ